MKELSENVYALSGEWFNTQIKLLFEIEEKINSDSNHENDKKSENGKKNIAVIYDIDGWAFHNIAKQIKNNLSEYYNIDIFPVSVFDDNLVKLVFLAEKYDLVHCLWRGLISTINQEYIKSYIHNLGLKYDEFIEKYLNSVNLTTSVYDHKFLDEESFDNTRCFAKYAKNYTVSSSILKNIYDKLDIDKKPVMVISDGVDLNKFSPKNLERFKVENIKDRKIRIGWVGNSKFVDSLGDNDLKGVRNIIIPAIQELIDEGYNIEMKFADRNNGYIPHDKMPDYYNSIDLYICASKNEGTPNPILESMASGIPIISTEVGIVNDAFGPNQKQFILKERTKKCLKENIVKMLSNLKNFEEISKENYKQIQDWTWQKKCMLFKKFFDQNLK